MTALAARGSTGNLPVEMTSFVGRRRELMEARALLSTTRLLTLTGMGGVGKTRLARQIASDVQRAFPDGVWEIELADLHEPALLVHTISAALGLREQNGPWAVTTLQDYLAERRVLLLLDNCEHLIEPCAITAHALLRTCPRLRILATSREPLAIGGEHVYPVGPLSMPDAQISRLEALAQYEAVRLFVDRGSAVSRGFALNATNQAAIVQLCARLDGVPLAIELAAVWLRTLSPAEIVTQLADRYQLLSKGSRSAPRRQQSLHALVDWSYQLCTEEEQTLWCLLSVFAQGFELDAVHAVCASAELDGLNVVEAVQGLVEKSVLTHDEQGDDEQAPAGRYRMPEIIRDYGVERLSESTGAATARHRHALWCLDLTTRAREQWVSPGQVRWFGRIRRELANIRAALDFSLTEPDGSTRLINIVADLTDYWLALGFLSEGRHWIDRALRRGPVTDLTRARALRTSSILAALQGDHEMIPHALEEARGLALRAGSDPELAWVVYAEALAALTRGDLPNARHSYAEARGKFQACGDVNGLIEALCDAAIVEAADGDLAGVDVRVAEFLAVAEPRGERWARSYALWALALARWRAGENRSARDLLAESMTLRRPFDDQVGIGLCVEVLAWIIADEGSAPKAAELLGAAGHALATFGSSVNAFGFVLDDHVRCEQSLRTTLGAEAFESALARGATMDVEEIAAFCTGETWARRPHRDALPATEPTPLTRREAEIATLIAQGMTNRDIAAALVIAPRTAEGHVEHILTKLGFTSRAQIAAWVAERRTAETDHLHVTN
jgi:predicted ATPase/DNA-binding CsgD family transcriptional regulator